MRPARRIEVSQEVHSTNAWGILEQVGAICASAGIDDLLSVEVLGRRFDNQGTLVNMAASTFEVFVVGFGDTIEGRRAENPEVTS